MIAHGQPIDGLSKNMSSSVMHASVHSRETTPGDRPVGSPSQPEMHNGAPPNQTYMYQQVGGASTPGHQMMSAPPSNFPNDSSASHLNGPPGQSYGLNTPPHLAQQSSLSAINQQPSLSAINSTNSANFRYGGMSQGLTPASAMSPLVSSPMTPSPMHFQSSYPAHAYQPMPGDSSVMSNISPAVMHPNGFSPSPLSSVPMIVGSPSPGMPNGQQPPVSFDSYHPGALSSMCMPANGPSHDLSMMSAGDINMMSNLPSIGSAGHCNGTCKRCCFHEKGRCVNGAACLFCHFPHEKRVRRKKNKNKNGVRAAGGAPGKPTMMGAPGAPGAPGPAGGPVAFAAPPSLHPQF